MEPDILVVVEKFHGRLKHFVERTSVYHDSFRSELDRLPRKDVCYCPIA